MRTGKCGGMTLIELLVSMGILVIVAVGASRSFEAAVFFQTKLQPRLEGSDQVRRIETRIANLLAGAYLSPGTGGTAATYFTAVASGESTWSPGLGDLSDQLTLTTIGVNPSNVYLSTTDDFENLNARFGPQGGMMEVSFEAAPIGDAGGATGPYLRTQRPADGDPTQGGWESVLEPNLAGINFEFWDGTTWVPEWDSSTMPTPRLPAAVRVTYALVGSEDTVHTFVVRIPLSDVTPDNPAGVGTEVGL
jgi:prepilin-type N-terminal cleavage/methylation domain-containing protein